MVDAGPQRRAEAYGRRGEEVAEVVGADRRLRQQRPLTHSRFTRVVALWEKKLSTSPPSPYSRVSEFFGAS